MIVPLFSNPQGTARKLGHGGTATPGSALILAVGGVGIWSTSIWWFCGDFSQGREVVMVQTIRVSIQRVHLVVEEETTSPYDPSPTSHGVGAKGSGRTVSTQPGDVYIGRTIF